MNEFTISLCDQEIRLKFTRQEYSDSAQCTAEQTVYCTMRRDVY